MFKNLNKLRNLIFYYYRYLIGNRRSRAGLIGWIVVCNSIESCILTLLLLFIVSSTASFSLLIGSLIFSSNLSSLLLFIEGDRVFSSLLLLIFRLGFRDCLLDVFFILRIRSLVPHLFIIGSISFSVNNL